MSSSPVKSDEQLMWEYVHGNYSSFEYLYQRHSKKVFGYIMMKVRNSEEAQEIFQNVFRKFHQSRNLYKEGMPVLPWLFTICKNTIVDNRRKAALTQNRHISVDNIDSIADSKSEFQEIAGEVEDVPGFEKLSNKEQEVIRLKYSEELDFKEISKKLGYSESNSRKISSRAIQKLKSFLKKELVK